MTISFEKKGIDTWSWIKFYIGGPLGMLSGFILFLLWRNSSIIVEDEFISKSEELKIKKINLVKPEFIQIRWENIIAVYIMKLPWPYSSGEKGLLIFPKSNTGDRERDEMINFEVKTNKKSKQTKAYANWLVVNKKGIVIPKGIKNCRDLLKEIHRKAPQAVIDEEIKKLIEK
jgi:hypothetical protein